MNAELAVQKLLESVKEEAARNNYSKVTAVHVKLGSWETVSTQALVKTFDRMKDSHLLSQASLVIDKRKTLAKCRYCGNLFEVIYLKSRCKLCGSNYMEFVGDRGISLEWIDGVE